MDDEVAGVLKQAELLFNDRASEKFFSSPNSNRYLVQRLGDSNRSVLAIGSIGASRADEASPYRPIADVVTVVTVDDEFLRNLAKTLNVHSPSSGC